MFYFYQTFNSDEHKGSKVLLVNFCSFFLVLRVFVFFISFFIGSDISAVVFVSEDKIYWFSPSGFEYTLCGHGNLAAALHFSRDKIILHNTHQGDIVITKKAQNEFIQELNPIEIFKAEADTTTLVVLNIVDSNILYFGKSHFGIFIYFKDPNVVKNMKPIFDLLKFIRQRNVVVMSNIEDTVIFRCFSPLLGIEEDQSTGSAGIIAGSVYASLNNKENEWLKLTQLSENGAIMHFKKEKTKVYLSGNVEKV